MDTPLSHAEWKVAELVGQGMSVEAIAKTRNRSSYTIVRQIQSCYDKLNIPRQLNALAVWYVCMVNKIDIPDYIKKGVAILLVVAAINTHATNPLRRPRMIARRTRTEFITEIPTL